MTQRTIFVLARRPSVVWKPWKHLSTLLFGFSASSSASNSPRDRRERVGLQLCEITFGHEKRLDFFHRDIVTFPSGENRRARVLSAGAGPSKIAAIVVDLHATILVRNNSSLTMHSSDSFHHVHFDAHKTRRSAAAPYPLRDLGVHFISIARVYTESAGSSRSRQSHGSPSFCFCSRDSQRCVFKLSAA